MSMQFTFLENTVVYLDPHGKVRATLLGDRSMTVHDASSDQELAELLMGNAPANFVINEVPLRYLTDTDHAVVYGAGAVPIDRGSASPSMSPSASPSSSGSASPSVSPSSSKSASPSAS